MREWLQNLLFFFQAEDGIRDTSVTGVQTCALPIYQATPQRRRHGRCMCVVAGKGNRELDRLRRPCRSRAVRSEERRVGKEWRSRRATGNYKKKEKAKKENNEYK